MQGGSGLPLLDSVRGGVGGEGRVQGGRGRLPLLDSVDGGSFPDILCPSSTGRRFIQATGPNQVGGAKPVWMSPYTPPATASRRQGPSCLNPSTSRCHCSGRAIAVGVLQADGGHCSGRAIVASHRCEQ